MLMESLHIDDEYTQIQFDRLFTLYTHPRRKYHNMEHIRKCLLMCGESAHLLENPLLVELALWYHDTIHNPPGYVTDSNEYLSYMFMSRDMDGRLPESQIRIVKELILATDHSAGSLSQDEKYIKDIDLVVLGMRGEEYINYYRTTIKQEFVDVLGVSENAYSRARRDFLMKLLDRGYIYSTLPFKHSFEVQAVKNISNELRWLRNEDQIRLCKQQ